MQKYRRYLVQFSSITYHFILPGVILALRLKKLKFKTVVIQTDVSNLVFYAQSTIAVISERTNRQKYKHTGKQLMTIPIVTAATSHDM